jgi:hypothetical protein
VDLVYRSVVFTEQSSSSLIPDYLFHLYPDQ